MLGRAPSTAGPLDGAEQGRARKGAIDLRLRLTRGDALPWRCGSPAAEEIPSSEVLHAARAAGAHAGAFLIGGGDPLRRADAWDLLAELAALRASGLGVCTPGHLVTADVARRLRSIGVERVQVPFHCARRDAHDWLAGEAGSLKAAYRAIGACREAGLAVAAEVVVTRPTAFHLPETVELLARLGVRAICVRRLTAYDMPGPELVPLSPRLSLLEAPLEQAAAAALARRVRLRLRDFPLCVAPRLAPLFAAPESELWVTSDGGLETRGEFGSSCATCPGAPRCAGVPVDYAARFGWEEFSDPAPIAARVHESVADQQNLERFADSQPMTFTWRGPHRVRCEACADAASESDGTHAAASIQQSPEPTRPLRARLVEAARYRPSSVRVVGAEVLAHPQAALLLYDALRLFRHVEVSGEASALANWSDLDLRRVKDLKRVDVALYGPDAATHDAHCGIAGAFAGMQRAVERLRTMTAIPVGAFAILHDARSVAAFADAWERGLLPGEPRFRLSAKGSSLHDLAAAAHQLAPGRARSALLAVLPRCTAELAGLENRTVEDECAPASHAPEHTIHCGRSTPYRPCGSDPFGEFDPCGELGQAEQEACAIPGCPGTAKGWESTARAERWIKSI